MRITAGFLKGQKLIESQQSKDLRPTTDRARESLFNILQNANFLQDINFNLKNSTILDLCCGTGAIAFEAISRGAKQALLIDKDSSHVKIAKDNAKKLKLISESKIIVGDALRPINYMQKFDLIFIDPPYGFKFDKLLRRLKESPDISAQSLIIIESNQKEEIGPDFKILDYRKYGINHFTFFTKQK